MANATLTTNQTVAIQKLEKSGFTRTQAEGIIEVLTDSTAELVTTFDLFKLELRLYKYFGGILIAHALGTAALTVTLLQLFR